MGYPVTNTLSTLFSRHTYISSDGLGLNMRCFVCNEMTRTVYSHPLEPRSIAKVCDMCGWISHPVKIPEAIK